ncbi:Flp family type IVb pilin [Shinella sumterensis]|uniref:Flp family type IVb pilin n=1 Tax=Shinella sumterensis TaxID=1967501 RepID=A0AA50H555_9HYPH|nr:Flp family type IVb pilin [Shinella sumterensis]WLR96903.1 Flp family type IVb pilin [Shinella sumterensis]
MTKIFARLMKDESGATAIEYGLIAALISVALIAGATSLGGTLNDTFNALSDKMDEAKTKSDGYAAP